MSWRKHYAWRPVRLQTGEWRWLQWVARRRTKRTYTTFGLFTLVDVDWWETEYCTWPVEEGGSNVT